MSKLKTGNYPALKFIENYNGKLWQPYFTTIRLNDDKYRVGAVFSVILGSSVKMGIYEVIHKKVIRLSEIDTITAYLDTGRPLDEAKALIRNVYASKNIDWYKQELVIILLERHAAQ